ncbi:ankyrin repeat and SOCS box protein 2-like [Mytilus californianus]|uniref:ankyrin repeat and SOCS box protein 2-like n=1 Tax=Mytilus californianus TaxID=6549 RepID=UPI0022467EEA|nr:ankyrin repeat and SOCS box protein 2-like [Mytilus californianus]
MTDIDDLSSKCDFFPLLCSLYHEKEDVNVKEYFQNPFDVYKSELDRLSEDGDEGKYKICSLALCVLYNNQLNEKWFQGKMTDEQRHIIADTCEACECNSIPKAKLKKALDTLDGTFICKQNSIYKTVHDKLFDFLAHYFGQKIIECLIDHGDSGLVHERFIWQSAPDDQNSNIEFIIEIPNDYLESYLERFIKDWSAGKVADVFSNNNMKISSFRQKLLQYLQQLDKSQQVKLAGTKNTVIPQEDCGSGNTPLIDTCYSGYTDMVQWMLHNDVYVDQCRDDGVTGLYMASQNGHSDIVKLLLEKNPEIDLCENGGSSPLYKTHDGGNALYFSTQTGNVAITQLLLANNADRNICSYSKQKITDTVNKDQSQTLDEYKQGLIDSFLKNTTSYARYYISKKSADYVFSVDAGSSPLHIACFMGRMDVVQCLLDHNADINMTKEDGTTPLFYACEVGHEDIVRLLLDKGADTQICRLDGKSPLKIATDNGHTSIVMMVTEHMNKKENLSS